jgi:hypothetical protein
MRSHSRNIFLALLAFPVFANAESLTNWFAGCPAGSAGSWNLEAGETPNPVFHYNPGGRYAALWSYFNTLSLEEGKTLAVSLKFSVKPAIRISPGALIFGVFYTTEESPSPENRFLGNDLSATGPGIGWLGYFISRYGISVRKEGNQSFYGVGGAKVSGLPGASTYGQLETSSEYELTVSIQRKSGNVEISGTLSDGISAQPFSASSEFNPTTEFNAFGFMNADFLGTATSFEVQESEVSVK